MPLVFTGDAIDPSRHPVPMLPSIAVVVTCYNKAPWIEAALASVAAQLHPATEIVVVDDGSTDDSAARAASMAARWPALPFRIIRQANSGQPAHARNAGIATVTSEIVVCLDADDAISPLYLHAVARAFAADPGLGLVWPDVIAFDEQAQRAWPRQEWQPARQAQVNLLPCITAFRRTLWAQVGGYRTNVRGYEDWDLWVAFVAAGARGQRVPFPHFHYRESGSGVYASTASRDLLLRASIVTNNPTLYGEATRALAAAIVADAPFDAMASWESLDEILRTGCVNAAMHVGGEARTWARAVVAAGTVATERTALERLAAAGRVGVAEAQRLGALAIETGDTARGSALLLLAWSMTTREAQHPAAPATTPPRASSPAPHESIAPIIAAPLASASRTPRVLAWMPYGQWAVHGLQEMTILHGARWRGAEVRYVLCDSAFRECDMHWAATAPRRVDSCTQCRLAQGRQATGLEMPHEWLGRHITAAERAMAAEWSATLERDELCDARWNERPIGAWILSSVHSHHRTNRVDPRDAAHEATLRAYLEAGLLVAFAMDRLLAMWRPDVMLLFNGRQATMRVAFELARMAGVRVVTHERGWRSETMYLAENADCLSIAPLREAWGAWRDVPLTDAEFATTAQWLHDRAHGRGLNWRAFTAPPGAHDAVRRALALRDDAPLVAVFTSSEDEYIACPDYASPFGTQERWLEATLAWAAMRPDVDMVVRVHPNTGGKVANGTNAGQLAWLHALAATAPANVRFVWPDDAVSSYSLMELARVGCSYVSTVALEQACRGGIALTAATSTLSGHGFTADVTDPAAYAAQLDALLAEDDAARADARRTIAWRFAHFAVHRYMLPFPLVAQPTPHDATLGYGTLDALRPGRDAGLDAAVSILLDGRPVCPPPASMDGRDAAREALLHADAGHALRDALVATAEVAA